MYWLLAAVIILLGSIAVGLYYADGKVKRLYTLPQEQAGNSTGSTKEAAGDTAGENGEAGETAAAGIETAQQAEAVQGGETAQAAKEQTGGAQTPAVQESPAPEEAEQDGEEEPENQKEAEKEEPVHKLPLGQRFNNLLHSHKLLGFVGVCIAVGAVILLLSVFAGGVPLQAPMLRNMLVFYWLLAIAVIDFEKRIIPNKLVLLGLCFWVLWAVYIVATQQQTFFVMLVSSVIGMLFAGVLFLACALLAKNSVGMGDVKMFSVIGLLYGFQGAFNIIFNSLLLMFFAGLFILIFLKKGRKTRLPMAPFVLAGFALACVLGI